MASPFGTCTGVQQRDIRLACVLDRPANLIQVQRDPPASLRRTVTRHTASVCYLCQEEAFGSTIPTRPACTGSSIGFVAHLGVAPRYPGVVCTWEHSFGPCKSVILR